MMNEQTLQDALDLLHDLDVSIANLRDAVDALYDEVNHPVENSSDESHNAGMEDGIGYMVERATELGLTDDLLDIRINHRRLSNLIESVKYGDHTPPAPGQLPLLED
jgi:hypothetical protein